MGQSDRKYASLRVTGTTVWVRRIRQGHGSAWGKDVDLTDSTGDARADVELLEEKGTILNAAIALQKHIALTLDQADRIVDAVNRAGVPFTMAWQMRVDPHNLKVKSLLDSGEFPGVSVRQAKLGTFTDLKVVRL